MLASLLQDAAVAARSLRRRRVFPVVAIGSLALAIGATTAIFTVVDAVLLRPLPFAGSGDLVEVFGRAWQADRPGAPDPIDGPVGSLELETFHREATTVADLAGFSTGASVLDGPLGPERVTTVSADLGLFTLLGAAPIAGRTFDRRDSLDVVVIAEALWDRRWRRDPAVIGQQIALDGRMATLLGVMPAAFQFPYSAASILPAAQPEARTDVWRPLEPLRTSAGALRRGRVHVVARLQPGVAADAATAELSAIGRRLSSSPAAAGRRVDARAVPLADVVSDASREILWALLAAAALVLAAACANVGNLQLAQMAVRLREVTTRAALGASPARLVRHCLLESLLLGLAAGALGLLLARAALTLLLPLVAAYLPRTHEITLDLRVFAFAFAISVLTAVLFGLAPAIGAARVEAAAVMKEGGHATLGRRFTRLRDALVVVEVALAAALAFGALAVMREMARLANTSDGLTRDAVLTMHLSPRAEAGTYGGIVERVAALPGVDAAGMIQLVPLQHWGWEGQFVVRGRPDPPMPTELRYVTPEYFRTVGMPILRGRGFTADDIADRPPVIVVNDALVERYFPSGNPVGVETDRGTIVGVVGSVRQSGVRRPPAPELYYPIAQNVAIASDAGMSLLVRTDAAPEAILSSIRSAVRSIAPSLAIFGVKTLDEIRRESLAEVMLYRWLTGLFAALALALAAIGLAGLIAYHASTRAREFAVRLALGASPRTLARSVVARAFALVAAGVAAGAVVVAVLLPAARTVPGAPAAAADSSIYMLVALLMFGVGGAASIGPAIRAAIIRPIAVLRHE